MNAFSCFAMFVFLYFKVAWITGALLLHGEQCELTVGCSADLSVAPAVTVCREMEKCSCSVKHAVILIDIC